jgi:hypothetical protein
MKKPTLKERILKYLKNQGGFVASGEIQRLAMNAGYTPQNAGRRCREAVEDGLLEVEYRERNHAYYKAVPQQKTTSTVTIEGGVAVERQKTIVS